MTARATTLDRALGTHADFGDSERILHATTGYYRFIIDILGEWSAEAAALGERLNAVPSDPAERVLLDPVLRVTLRGALATRDATGSDSSAAREVLRRAAVRLSPRRRADGPSLGHDFVELRRRLPVWLAPAGADPYATAFENLFRAHIIASHVTTQTVLRRPTERELRTLSGAIELLEDALPATATGALRHVAVAAVVDVDVGASEATALRSSLFTSASTYAVPGAIFLAPRALSDTEEAAEAIFHEAVHTKLFDLYVCRSLLAAEYDAAEAASISVPWRRGANGGVSAWSLDRALGAFHVYVHLAVLFHALGRVEKAVTAASRAIHLGAEVRQAATTELRDSGRRMVEWLLAVLSELPDEVRATARQGTIP